MATAEATNQPAERADRISTQNNGDSPARALQDRLQVRHLRLAAPGARQTRNGGGIGSSECRRSPGFCSGRRGFVTRILDIPNSEIGLLPQTLVSRILEASTIFLLHGNAEIRQRKRCVAPVIWENDSCDQLAKFGISVARLFNSPFRDKRFLSMGKAQRPRHGVSWLTDSLQGLPVPQGTCADHWDLTDPRKWDLSNGAREWFALIPCRQNVPPGALKLAEACRHEWQLGHTVCNPAPKAVLWQVPLPSNASVNLPWAA